MRGSGEIQMAKNGLYTEVQGLGYRTPHSLREGSLDLLARGDFPLQIRGVGQHPGIEAAVLIDAASLCRKDAGEALVFAGELPDCATPPTRATFPYNAGL